MQPLKDQLLTILRNKETSIDLFRRTTEQLSTLLAHETALLLEREPYSITTPVTAMEGTHLKETLLIVPILRSGLAMLPSFERFFEESRVGILGYWREEKTAKPVKYYEKLPQNIQNDRVLIIDPMLATGGTAADAVELLMEKGVAEEKMIFVGIIASPEGKEHLSRRFPKIKIVLGAEDERLNDVKYIVPGLGDFGDRYFGTL